MSALDAINRRWGRGTLQPGRLPSTDIPQSSLTQAACTHRLQAQVLIVLDQVLHREVRMGPSRLILPLDKADSTPIAIPLLVVIAAMGIALKASNLLPQFADLNRLPDIPAYLSGFNVAQTVGSPVYFWPHHGLANFHSPFCTRLALQQTNAWPNRLMNQDV